MFLKAKASFSFWFLCKKNLRNSSCFFSHSICKVNVYYLIPPPPPPPQPPPQALAKLLVRTGTFSCICQQRSAPGGTFVNQSSNSGKFYTYFYSSKIPAFLIWYYEEQIYISLLNERFTQFKTPCLIFLVLGSLPPYLHENCFFLFACLLPRIVHVHVFATIQGNTVIMVATKEKSLEDFQGKNAIIITTSRSLNDDFAEFFNWSFRKPPGDSHKL